MSLAFLRFVVLFSLFEFTIHANLSCYKCKAQNDSPDFGDCFLPDELSTSTEICTGVCYTNVTKTTNEAYQIERGCDDFSSSSNGTEPGKKACSTNLCNIHSLDVPCYSCGFSTTGAKIYINGRSFDSSNNCLKVDNTTTPKIKCATRCMESHHVIQAKENSNITIFVRDCEPNMSRYKLNAMDNTEYRQCYDDLCNNKTYGLKQNKQNGKRHVESGRDPETHPTSNPDVQ